PPLHVVARDLPRSEPTRPARASTSAAGNCCRTRDNREDPVSKLTRDIEIAASPDAVWDVLMDPDHLGDWVTIQEDLEEAPEGDLVNGSRIVQRCRVAGQRFN